jgi:endonuclease/exonuclease/phosphatase family metal-dependent hydrolase
MSPGPDMRHLHLRVVTFNAYHGYPLCAHIERRFELLREELSAHAPDIVLLQEISVSTLYGHLPARLVDGLRGAGRDYHLAYSPANGSVADGGAFEEGSAILSRWPIVESEARRLAANHPVWRNHHGYEYVEHRIALHTALEIAPGMRLDVYGTHISDVEVRDGVNARALQIEDLARFVDERPTPRLPAIVGGDFNAAPDAPEITRARNAGFYDVCEGREPGPTNDRDDRDLDDPRDTANQRIDYLFTVGEGVAVRSVGLFLDSAVEIEAGRFLWCSDHSGIEAELEISL